ncbi:hypothetical protein TWF970_006877 [Orbilia oligospora]|uniref:Aminotransferase class I/classII large domain-containing protein n=1 Tax=Orbilia oligospora TaxID=2813651 RepID=A0A7C8R5W9_ORBOL|nr:hypothetical protein TWF970_006877 [Orbilia oligospora]
MVYIRPFNVEQWMDKYETKCTNNIAETCCDSVSLAELISLTSSSTTQSHSETPLILSLSKKRLDYGHIRGSPTLLTNISTLYSTPSNPFPFSQILITPGAIAANFLVFYTLIHPSHHVICIHPTYQQLHSVPASLGASVSLWKLQETETSWNADINELKSLIVPGATKLLVLNNPNNPTGAVLPLEVLMEIKVLAEKYDITVLSDEVYAPIYHSSPDPPPPSFLTLGYKNTIVTGSLSKAYSLAGIRIGWIASNNADIIELLAQARDYNTIAVSQLDDIVAAYALSPTVRRALVKRNIDLCEKNLELLDDFIRKYPKHMNYVKPVSGTTAFVKFLNPRSGKVVDDVRFCEALTRDTGVLFVPGGHCFGVDEGEFKGYVRIGYACSTDTLRFGLMKVGAWIEGGGMDFV